MGGRTKVVILGGGPAGLGAALGLARRGLAPTLIERQGEVGGNAGSFELHGVRVDYGSHRLHPSTDPEILATVRSLLGPDLLERPRHGRILLSGRWIHFPLRPLNLALRAPPGFILGVGWDLLSSFASGKGSKDGAAGGEAPARAETFASVLSRGLGSTICREFYFPYARKIWGLDPDLISPDQAERRVSASSTGKLLRRLLPGGAGGGGKSSRGTFFYPRDGFGQISEALAQAAVSSGAKTLLNTTVRGVVARQDGFGVEVEGGGRNQVLDCDGVWSTIPLGNLVRILDPPPPPDLLLAAESLEQRAMLLVYLVLEQDRFTEFDAHYFPGLDVPFTRMSEPKNYAGKADPAGRTVLCAEIPCSAADPIWREDGSALGALVCEGLEKVGLPIESRILETVVRRLPSAYPVYRMGYEAQLDRIESWLSGLPGIVSFGRQGLFAHDNTHHALFTAQAAVRCLGDDGRFDEERWAAYRETFASHVVED